MFPALNRKKVIITTIILLLLVSSGFFLFQWLSPKPLKQVTLTYWGFWDAEVAKPLIDEYVASHPNTKIDYVRKVPEKYRETLQTRLAAGSGPDIFRFHNSWLPMLRTQLSAVPPTVFTPSKFEEIFYPTVESDLKRGGQYYGIPLEFDSLVLVYNQDLFSAKGYQSPPTTWDQLRNYAATLTTRDEKGNVLVGGAALGTASNVEYFSDVIGLMLLQNGVEMIKEGKVNFDKSLSKDEAKRNLGADALDFYTNFAKVDKIWSEALPPSIEAFASGKAAMIFIPSERLFDVLYLSRQKGQNLNFGVAPVPQLEENSLTKVSWARYYAEGVSKTSKNQAEAWDFLKFLSEKESLRKLYQKQKETRGVGEPYGREDMSELLTEESYAKAVLTQSSYAKNWYLNSQTFDDGLNDRLVSSLEKTVKAVLTSGNASLSLSGAGKEAATVLGEYGLVTAY